MEGRFGKNSKTRLVIPHTCLIHLNKKSKDTKTARPTAKMRDLGALSTNAHTAAITATTPAPMTLAATLPIKLLIGERSMEAVYHILYMKFPNNPFLALKEPQMVQNSKLGHYHRSAQIDNVCRYW